jgi:biopolymer transport protein ExbB
MRVAILAFLLTAQLAAWPTGYGYRRSVVIDHSLVASPGQTDVPVVISGVYGYLAVTGSGGKVQHTTTCCAAAITAPADLIFTGSDQTTLLSWDVESYSSSTGALTVWVKVPAVSSSADTTLYMFYSNAAVTTYQSTYASTYDANYKGVFHFNGSLADSTGTVATGTNQGTTAASSPKLGGALNLVKTSSQYVDFGSPVETQLTDNLTLSVWGWSDQSTPQSLFVNQFRLGTLKGIALVLNNLGADAVNVIVCDGSTSSNTATSALVNDSAWHQIAMTFASGLVTVYVDGAAVNTVSAAVTHIAYGAEALRFGANAALNTFYSGNIDDATISSVVRTPDYIATVYHNQSNPSVFSTIGAEVPSGTPRKDNSLWFQTP